MRFHRVGFICLGLAVSASLTCEAQARWCDVQAAKGLAYPPLARAAHVYGLALLRVNYSPAGKYMSSEVVQGPPLLVDSAVKQLQRLTIETTAAGTAPCESLFLINFELDDGNLPPIAAPPNTPGMFRETIRAYPLVISDPAPTLGKRRKRFGIF